MPQLIAATTKVCCGIKSFFKAKPHRGKKNVVDPVLLKDWDPATSPSMQVKFSDIYREYFHIA